MGTTRPARRLKKSWITGSLALGVVAASGGVAMASHQSEPKVGLVGEHESEETVTPAVTSGPGGELCLRLDKATLKKIHAAEKKARGASTEVKVPAEVVFTCSSSPTPPPSTTAQPTPPPTTSTPVPTTSTSTPPPPPPTTKTPTPTPTKSTATPTPTVTSTAS